MKGMAKSALQALKGEKATVLVDKLAERLAFERTGTRLYETLIQKAQAVNGADRSATVRELERICREELNHFICSGTASKSSAPIQRSKLRLPMSRHWHPKESQRFWPTQGQLSRNVSRQF
jgi:hypothetical protein